MKKILFSLCSVLLLWSCQKETAKVQERVIRTEYINYFWEAFDSIQTADNYFERYGHITQLYTEKSTEELTNYREKLNYNDDTFLKLIEKYPKFWQSVRTNTLQVNERIPEVHRYLDKFKELYPQMKEGTLYFTIGAMNSLGTTIEDDVFLSAELLCWDENVDTSELHTPAHEWFKEALRKPRTDAFLHGVVHEYVHIQQKTPNVQVLNLSILEGSCDFIAELVLEEELNTKYISYGKAHYQEVLAEFRKELFTKNWINWVRNGGGHSKCSDLGYFMGYTISKAYYEKAEDKKAAIKAIIELDYSDDAAVVDFLNQSGIYQEKLEPPKQIASDLPYTITFHVKVPNAEDEVFLSGNLEELGYWKPNHIKLNKVSDFERSITLTLKPPFEFKFNRGSWDSEAYLEWKTRGAQQRYTAQEDAHLYFTVERWKDRN